MSSMSSLMTSSNGTKLDSVLGISAATQPKSPPTSHNQLPSQGSMASQGGMASQEGVTYPVTFRSAGAYTVIKMKIYGTFSIKLQIRTLQSDGLILYMSSSVGGVDGDFLALELVQGHPRYTFNTGNGPRTILSALPQRINDNSWHNISIVRSDLTRHTLIVDDCPAVDTHTDLKSVHFDLNHDLYVGGLPERMFKAPAGTLLPRTLRAIEGFHGCLGSVTLNGVSKDLLAAAKGEAAVSAQMGIGKEEVEGGVIGLRYKGIGGGEGKNRVMVSPGCTGPSSECQEPGICNNHGNCVQQWNAFTCDCDMTSYTGPTCSDDGVTYFFGHSGGVISYSFRDGELPDTRIDILAFGFMTSQRNAVLTRVTSGSSTDFLEVELVDGNIFVTYNLGLTDHVIGDLVEKVNDGRYHVVRFTRRGSNSTLQIDEHHVQNKTPTGPQLTTFNHQSKVFIGGKRSVVTGGGRGGVLTGRDQHTLRYFHGSISGFSLNGLHVLELAAQRNIQVDLEGEIELVLKSTLRPWLTTSQPRGRKVTPSIPPPLPGTPRVTRRPVSEGHGGEEAQRVTDQGSAGRGGSNVEGGGGEKGQISDNVFENREEKPAGPNSPDQPPSWKRNPSEQDCKSTTSLDVSSGCVDSSGEGSDDEEDEEEEDGEDRDGEGDNSDTDSFSPEMELPSNLSNQSSVRLTTPHSSEITSPEIEEPVVLGRNMLPPQGFTNTAYARLGPITIMPFTNQSLIGGNGWTVFSNETPGRTYSPDGAGLRTSYSPRAPLSGGNGGRGTEASKRPATVGFPGWLGDERVLIGIGVSLGAIVLFGLLALGFYRYRSRDQGSYRIDNRNYSYEICRTAVVCGGENGGTGTWGGDRGTVVNGGAKIVGTLKGGGGAYKMKQVRGARKNRDEQEWYV